MAEKPLNAALCSKCLTVIFSFHHHDWTSCTCPEPDNIFVDGGTAYFRYGGPESSFIRLYRDPESDFRLITKPPHDKMS